MLVLARRQVNVAKVQKVYRWQLTRFSHMLPKLTQSLAFVQRLQICPELKTQ